MDDADELVRVLGGSLRVVLDGAGDTRVEPGYALDWRILPTALVAVVDDGPARIEIDGRPPFTIAPGQGLALPSGVRHRLRHPIGGRSRWTHSSFHVLSGVDALALAGVPPVIAAPVAARVVALIERLVPLPASGSPRPAGFVPTDLSPLRIACATQAIGLDLLDVLLGTAPSATGAASALHGAQRLAPVLAAVEHDLAGITLPAMARRAGLSSSQLHALFTRCFACAPMRYVRRRRFQRARELLAGTAFSVGEVAERSGFPDQFHFSRAFKKEHGVGPLAYREKMAGMTL